MGTVPKKSLGQHWLQDRYSLEAMAAAADIGTEDTVLEIGPGLGTLTVVLAKRAKNVVCVEFDGDLAAGLAGRIGNQPNVTTVHHDILTFDLTEMPVGYKVAANVPYYITSAIVRALLTSSNPPSRAALLVQKEVAERLAATPGDMSILSVSAQAYAEVALHDVVPATLFTPPPKVDSQIVSLRYRQHPDLTGTDMGAFWRVVKAGFSERRKILRGSLSGGLAISKDAAEDLLTAAGIDAGLRAQNLTMAQWAALARAYVTDKGKQMS